MANKVVAIGALGGSGTRALSQMVIDLGYYLGDDLNNPKDNLLFTRLFKDPVFYQRMCSDASGAEVTERLRVFEQYMRHNHLSRENAAILKKAADANPTFQKKTRLSFNILKKRLTRPIDREKWGWKEPNTQLYLKQISNYFPGIKYIHLLRHGLDMAFSRNIQQLENWGHLFDLALDEGEPAEQVAYKQLTYWIRSTQKAIEDGKRLEAAGGEFLLINFTHFHEAPLEVVDRILSLLDEKVSDQKRTELAAIVKKPGTTDRYKNHDLGIFDQSQLDAVRELGFAF